MQRAASVAVMGLVLVGLGFSLASPAEAAPKAGAPCAKVGKQVVTNQWIFTCTKKKGAGPVWVRKPRTAPTPSPTPSPSNDAEIASLAFPATRGVARPAPADAKEGGPWSTGMAVSPSVDGTSFAISPSLIDQAGVPNLVALPDGRLLAYFVSWAQGNVMAVGIRDDAGRWAYFRVAVEGFQTDVGGANGVDPSAVVMSDGSIRLFWMQPVGSPGRSQIYSATSSPGSALGVRFVVDPGPRLDRGTMVYDPTVAHCAGSWLMWVNSPEGPVFAASSDGRNFIEQPMPPGLGPAFPWSSACLADGRTRLLVSRGASAGLPFVGDAAGFIEDGPSVLPISALPDAGWARLPDGTWALGYLARMD
ncbi:MAG: hypothetical protein RL134_1349 [Actinomycetota bacterium]|jgi:hypothetical protein